MTEHSEPMTKERAYTILEIPAGSNFRTMSLAFRRLREKYDPETHPYSHKEYAELLAAFKYLQLNP